MEEAPENPVSVKQAKAKKPEAKKPEAKKRELKSAKRKDGVPALKRKAKKNRKKKILIGVLIFIALFISIFFLPRVGSIQYGICKAFVELHDPYPSFLEFVGAYEEGNMALIDYNRVDSFGQRSLNQIRCVFHTDPNHLSEISRVDINGKFNKYPQEAPEVVAKFNRGIPSLLQNQPSLILPKGLPENIKDYR